MKFVSIRLILLKFVLIQVRYLIFRSKLIIIKLNLRNKFVKLYQILQNTLQKWPKQYVELSFSLKFCTN